MSIRTVSLFIWLTTLLFSCARETKTLVLHDPGIPKYGKQKIDLSKEELHDRILGALVGSAIGDAMGLSTEMWLRQDIQLQYGYITGLTPALTNKSPEGSWSHNLPAGATTDDTRWKVALTGYIKANPTSLDADNFAQFIIDYYQDNAKTLADDAILTAPDNLDVKMKKINWIKEWARVAFAYKEDAKRYQNLRDRFYGGEISCAGLLYTPMFGLVAPNTAAAYEMAYEHSLFDMGYGKDISSIAAVMCNMALQTQNMDSILQASTYLDPYNYQDSRLIGRISRSVSEGVEQYVRDALDIDEIPLNLSLVLKDSIVLGKIEGVPSVVVHKDSIRLKIPKNYPGDALDWYRQETIYQALEQNQHRIAFQAGEIWEILYAGLLYGDGDFTTTLQFIINYGRDNDTVGAVAGMILGAKDGYAKLPEHLKKDVIHINKDLLGIDLEVLAQDLTELVHAK